MLRATQRKRRRQKNFQNGQQSSRQGAQEDYEEEGKESQPARGQPGYQAVTERSAERRKAQSRFQTTKRSKSNIRYALCLQSIDCIIAN
jgi:hypothetical protein